MEIHLLNTFAQTHGLTTENPVTLRPGKIPHFECTCREPGVHIPRRMRQQGPSLRSCQLADLLAIESLLWGPRGRSSGSSAPRRRCPGPARATLRARPLAAPSSRIITPHSLHMQLSSTSATREINPRHTPKNSGHRNRQPCVRARFLISSTPTRKLAVLLLAHSRQYRQVAALIPAGRPAYCCGVCCSRNPGSSAPRRRCHAQARLLVALPTPGVG